MRVSILVLSFACLMILGTKAQVSEMKWELDYQIYLKLSNDSNFIYDISDVFHVTNTEQQIQTDFVFYPVNPGEGYANDLASTEASDKSYTTLWSALHDKIGGGWVHFANCIAYSLEIDKLDLKAPLMKRPDSDWKPSPMTESFKRTRKWAYYVPVDQKSAIKEYNLKKEHNELGDLNSLPQGYISSFLNTNQKAYDKLIGEEKFSEAARIDLVKLMLGANYLGEAQITYISNAVLGAIKSYSTAKLPSVIIFDEYDAAAAMSLQANGYELESIVFQSSANLSMEQMAQRKAEIEKIIQDINDYNNNSFRKRLGNYYKE